jgi:hypothetical protein
LITGLDGVAVARRRGDGHRGRKHRRASRIQHVVREQPALESAETRLEVGADEQRDAGVSLKIVELGRDFDRRAKRHRHTADSVALDPPNHFGVAGVVHVGVIAKHPHHDHLADALAERERGERAIHPSALSVAQRDCRR